MQNTERILLIGDNQRQMYGATVAALPGAEVVSVASYFDGIAELAGGAYTTIVASAEPIERRPEAAVRTLRQLAGARRILLFGHSTLEPLARKMLDFGCDDYIISPPDPKELQQIFQAPTMRIASDAPATSPHAQAHDDAQPGLSPLMDGAMAQLVLESLLHSPQDSVAEAVRRFNSRLAPTRQLLWTTAGQPAPAAPQGMALLTHPVRHGEQEAGRLHLTLPLDDDQSAARHMLAHWASLFEHLTALQDRHKRLQKLAITDELTGVYNGRYFRYFLNSIIERAKERRFPVALLVFDIDNFKRYNDQFGHGVGDEILKQTAALMRRCCRDHDLVARISGDEFAVIFWEKEGPRQPRLPQPGPPSRRPHTALQILDRFRKLLKSEQFAGLGPAGQGVLTISGGMAVFPYDGPDAEALLQAADRELMFRAKRAGKNSIFLVGSEESVGARES